MYLGDLRVWAGSCKRRFSHSLLKLQQTGPRVKFRPHQPPGGGCTVFRVVCTSFPCSQSGHRASVLPPKLWLRPHLPFIPLICPFLHLFVHPSPAIYFRDKGDLRPLCLVGPSPSSLRLASAPGTNDLFPSL